MIGNKCLINKISICFFNFAAVATTGLGFTMGSQNSHSLDSKVAQRWNPSLSDIYGIHTVEQTRKDSTERWGNTSVIRYLEAGNGSHVLKHIML